VPLADASAALTAVRGLADRVDPLLLITELRTIAADDLWLSGAYGRDTLAIHFTWRNDPEGVTAVLPAIEAALEPFGARPHWGKWHAFDHERIAAVHPRAADARAVFEQLDPRGRFVNSHLRNLGLR
jgi:xylitol oxidase